MFVKALSIPPRIQWNANGGYCGETAMISAGLYYGQYVSQYDARAFASDGMDQSEDGSQLLLGPDQNDRHAAERMHLTFEEWDPYNESSSHDFLAWIKRQVVHGVPVAIGVYMNRSVFGKDSDNDKEYDHIVPVIGVESNYPLFDSSYYEDDVIVFSDNEVYTPDGEPARYIFKSQFGCFQKTRNNANLPSAGVYSLPVVTKHVKNYGIAITGVLTDGSTLPVRVDTDVNYERPPISEGSSERPTPMRLGLTVTVSGLEPGGLYKLYRYDSMENVPDCDFNKNALRAARSWDIAADTASMSLNEEIMSDEVAVYRVVRASAS